MRRHSVYKLLSFIVRCVVVGLALAFVLAMFTPGLVERLRGARSDMPTPAPALPVQAGPASYAEAVQRAAPAVVNIYANKITTLGRRLYPVPDPLTQRLLGYVPGPLLKRRDQSLGSGVIFSRDGYVLTNNHVVSGADDIKVQLNDGRVANAEVIGSDAETDLAVLKVALDSLPATMVADAQAAEVGDVVLAIGNPVGLGQTVTMGIVSATGRQLKMSAYEDFIQTDAAINAGNSGGALVNTRGELIGINTAIYPRTPSPDGRGTWTSSAEGIGFAIPVRTAKAVLEQIIKHGRVIRGWIGIDYIELPAAADAATREHGVLVARVVPDSPAAEAGLQPGDVLLKLDGTPIIDPLDLRNREAALVPGSRIRLAGRRDGVPFTVEVTLAERPPPGAAGT
ncbi:S1C family serine protease [Dokdonella sp.]|uniref:S1C family serine protease n=1 Tax=Dokdonella sp. TaxID=2291710 RepID=UPI0031C36800|nr:trypsin-like peptidase domain-containing protein [Dokdonella sp.]